MAQVATLHEQSLYPHALLKIDEIGNDPQAMAEFLGAHFGMRFPPAGTLGPARMAPGHWRDYREVMGPAFALLTSVAVRLGYPEE